MLCLKLDKDEIVFVGDAKIRVSAPVTVYIDAPLQTQVVRGQLAQKRLRREAFEILDDQGLNQKAPFEERLALAYLCQQYDLTVLAVKLAGQAPSEPNSLVAKIADRLKLPAVKGAA